MIRNKYKRTGIYSGKRQGLLYSLLTKLNKRMMLINQKAPGQNIRTSIALLFSLISLAASYMAIACNVFRGLWYHKVLCVLSAAIFVYLCEQTYFEQYEKRIKKDFPNTLKKFTHYYNHYKGNVIPALEDTILRCPKSNRIFIIKIKEALLKPENEKCIGELENRMPTIWLKMLCRIMLIAKENGGKVAGRNEKAADEDVISSNLKRLTNIVTFLNIEQGYNDAELLGMQIFVFFAPFLVIPVTRWYNSNLLTDLNMEEIYGSIQAQGLVAIMLFVSSLGALFIHWMRKLQN